MALVDRLFSGPLDIVGDIHGEIDALERLIEKLGYQDNGTHAENRRLVFVGDLVDRGPDSPAVLDRVMALVRAGAAQCALGNHELNLLLGDKKEGNHWFTDPADEEEYPAQPVDEERKPEILAFLSSLPLALERADLRVVHACWNSEKIARIRASENNGKSVTDLYDQYKAEIDRKLKRNDLTQRYEQEKAEFASNLKDRSWSNPIFLSAHADIATIKQMDNPVKVLTSGEERPVKAPFWAGGKWRMEERCRWWEDYEDSVPVIVGHYWRRFNEAQEYLMDKFGPDLFEDVAPHEWMGTRKNVYCVDFSVGKRHRETGTNEPPYEGKLSALRVPEWEVWHDDESEIWKIGLPSG